MSNSLVPEFYENDPEMRAAQHITFDKTILDFFRFLAQDQDEDHKLKDPAVWRVFAIDVLKLPDDETTAYLADLSAFSLLNAGPPRDESRLILQRIIAGIFLLGILNSFWPTHPAKNKAGTRTSQFVNPISVAFQSILNDTPANPRATDALKVRSIATLQELAWDYAADQNLEGPHFEKLHKYILNTYNIPEAHATNFANAFWYAGKYFLQLVTMHGDKFDRNMRPAEFSIQAMAHPEIEAAKEFVEGLELGRLAFGETLYSTYW